MEEEKRGKAGHLLLDQRDLYTNVFAPIDEMVRTSSLSYCLLLIVVNRGTDYTTNRQERRRFQILCLGHYRIRAQFELLQTKRGT